MPKPMLYVAGPYSAKTVFGRIWNIYKAGKVALKYWESYQYSAVICPHLNSALMGEWMFHSDICSYSTWMHGDLEILRRCDAVVFMKNWQRSRGARREWDFAVAIGKEIIYD